jgi:hypothetical protein
MMTPRLVAILFVLVTVMTVTPQSGDTADLTVSIPGSYVIGWIDDAINDYLALQPHTPENFTSPAE